MSGEDRYALGGHAFIYTPGGEPQQQATRRSYDTYGMRENYRREVEHLITPKREWALAENKAAIDLAQSALKTSVLINVGGFVAIQAAVPLFKLDAAAIQWPLLSTGIWFAAGLTVAWIAHGIAFHALALGSSQANSEADAITFMLLGQFNPDKAPAWAADQIKVAKKARRLKRRFAILCMIGILLFWASALLFFGGAGDGVCTIIGALPPPPQSAGAGMFAVICKPWTYLHSP
jgi:hypothetical protein